MRITSPTLLKENKSANKLNVISDIAIFLEVGITGKQREKLKTELAKRLHDPFAPTTAFKSLKKLESGIAVFERREKGLVCNNVMEVVTKRIRRLQKSG